MNETKVKSLTPLGPAGFLQMYFIPELLSAPLTTVGLQMIVAVINTDANTLLIKTAAAAAKAFHNLIYMGKNI